MIEFTKYHGCGNNFVIIRSEQLKDITNLNELAIKVCDVKTGIGADGLIIVKTNPLEMLFFNQDGQEGTMCGNGIRCFAKYVSDESLINSDNFMVITKAGIKQIKIVNKDPFLVEVDLGEVFFDNNLTGLNTLEYPYLFKDYYYQGDKYQISVIYVGNVHTVVFVNDLDKILKLDLGKDICFNSLFKDQTNVDFVKVVSKDKLLVETYERGVGFTTSCGTGAGASFYISRMINLCNDEVIVESKYGKIKVFLRKDHLIITGPAERICQGIIE